MAEESSKTARTGWSVKLQKKTIRPEPAKVKVKTPPFEKKAIQLKPITVSPTPSPKRQRLLSTLQRAQARESGSFMLSVPRSAGPTSPRSAGPRSAGPASILSKPASIHDNSTESSTARLTSFFQSLKPIKVGEGTYGCVYSPAIPCEDAREPYCPSCVSKLMEEQAAEEELVNYRALQGIDDRESGIIKSPRKCKPHRAVVNKSMPPCYLRGALINNPTIITYPNGGPNLWNEINVAKRDFRHVIKHFANIINATALLNKAGVYHLDIKEANIVTGINGNGPYRLIDFGLMEKIVPTNPPVFNDIYLKFYEVWPVDIVFLSEDAKLHIQEHVTKFLRLGNVVTREYKAKGYTVESIMKHLARKMKSSASNNYYETIAKVDVYSIGRILLEFANRYDAIREDMIDLINRTRILAPNASDRVDADTLYKSYRIAFARFFV